MLVPIGSWCRTAYQVREFLKSSGVKSCAYPYDWTITPFYALKSTMINGFDRETALQFDALALNQFGSLEDAATRLIHHHDFAPHKLSSLDPGGGVNQRGVPLALVDSDLLIKAKGRFQYAYANLAGLRDGKTKIGFVRWMRHGHPDRKIPDAFDGENLTSLSELISNFLGHEDFSILLAKSVIVQGALPENDIIVSYERNEMGVSAIIKERKGFDGDGSNSFKGDTVSWRKLLARYATDENISLD